MKWKTLAAGQLDRLVKSSKPVYVLNTSVLPSGDKGTIIINFYDGTRREFFKMPPTFIPVAASDVIPPERLSQSRDFKQSLVKGMLTLVDPDQAADYLETREAREEYEILMLSEHSQKSRGINIEAEVAKRTRVSHQGNASAGPRDETGPSDTVSNRVRGFMESLTSKTMTAQEVLINLRRHQSALSDGDLSYVIANSEDKGLKSWASKALAEQAGEAPARPAVKKAVTAAKKELPLAKKKDDDTAFDFEKPMSAEEQRQEAEAMSKAAGQQALHGESQIESEIDRLLAGKR
jgi:hypothetical protein